MTKKQLEELGFREYRHEHYTHHLYSPYVVEIKKEATLLDVMNLIYMKGLENGKHIGWKEFSEKICDLLNVKQIEE